jgi:hypothetical protein
VDEVGQPGGAQPGWGGERPADDAFVGRSGLPESNGVRPANGAHPANGTHPANGNQPVNGERSTNGSNGAVHANGSTTPVAAPISPAWRVAQPHRMFDGASDHAQLLASLRVARANIGRAPAGNAVLDPLTEDTIESLTVPTSPDEPDMDADDRLDEEADFDDTVDPLALSPEEPSDDRYPSDEPPPSIYDAIPRGHAPYGNGTAATRDALIGHAAHAGAYGRPAGYRPPQQPTETPPIAPGHVEAPAHVDAVAYVEGHGAPEPPPPGLVPLLPHRIPAPPDVPDVPDDEFDDYDPDAPELDRIANRLRDDEAPAEPPADLDVAAVLEAVRHVPGVADAQLRGNPGGMHTLRLDLADGADAGRVSRQVARLLKERMGLAAEPRRARPVEPDQPVTAPQPPPAAAARPFPRPRPATLTDVAARANGRARAEPEVRSEPIPDAHMIEAQPRVAVDQVRVSTLGTDATVEVRLTADGRPSVGAASGPAVDGYLLRLAAQAAASAIDGLVESTPSAPHVRCFIDHAGVVPFGSVAVAVVVVLITGPGWVEQLVGSALVGGDPRQAIVRATLAAVNRRLDSLLA